MDTGRSQRQDQRSLISLQISRLLSSLFILSCYGCAARGTAAVVVDPGNGMQKVARLSLAEAPSRLEGYTLEWELADREPYAALPDIEIGGVTEAHRGQRGSDGKLLITETVQGSNAVLEAPIPYSELLGPEDNMTVRWQVKYPRGVSSVLSTFQLAYDIALEQVELLGAANGSVAPHASYQIRAVAFNNSAKEVLTPFPVSLLVESTSGGARSQFTVMLTGLKPYERSEVLFPPVTFPEEGTYAIRIEANAPPREQLPEIELANNTVTLSVKAKEVALITQTSRRLTNL